MVEDSAQDDRAIEASKALGRVHVAEAIWGAIEDELKEGTQPLKSHIAEAFRHGQPVSISAGLQGYIAELLEPPHPPKKTVRQKASLGETLKRAYEFLAEVDEARAREIAIRGRRGSLKRALTQVRQGNFYANERHYRRAMRLTGRAKLSSKKE